MASTEYIFRQAVPYTYEHDGVVNGQRFTIKGKGVGDSTAGTLKGKYWCTTGKVPMFWKALAPLLRHGLKCSLQAELGEYYAGALITVNRPLGSNSRSVQPGPHYQRTELKQFKDANSDVDEDSVIQEEIIEGFHCNRICDIN